jgi:hypothetical protein
MLYLCPSCRESSRISFTCVSSRLLMLQFPPYLHLELYFQNLVVRLQRHYIGLIARQALRRFDLPSCLLFLHYLVLQYRHCFVCSEICCNISIHCLASICYIGSVPPRIALVPASANVAVCVASSTDCPSCLFLAPRVKLSVH